MLRFHRGRPTSGGIDAHKFFRTAIRVQGERAIAEGVTDARDVALDKSFVAAQGDLGTREIGKRDTGLRAWIAKRAGDIPSTSWSTATALR